MNAMLRSLWVVLGLSLIASCARLYSHVRASSPSETDGTPCWIADRVDNICGLDDLHLLSNPAKINYGLVLQATPEMKKIREQHIDPECPEGIQLRAKAVDRVRTAAEKARVAGGYCSVWKRIAHRDGRVVPDISNEVLAVLCADPIPTPAAKHEPAH